MNRRLSLATGVFLVGFALTATATAQDPPLLSTTVSPNDLQTLVPDLMSKAHIPGLSVAVIREGDIVWSAAFGVKNTETKEPCNDSTIFEAASLTKPLFAYLALLYVADGKLDLDKPLVDYLPEQVIIDEILTHPLDQPGFRRDWFEKITARHVLSHSSGMPHGDPIDSCYPQFFEPGSEYRYSAAGFYFLQLVLENMEGAPLEQIAQARVLDPLGMTQSCLVWRDAYEKTAANGHNMLGEPQDHRRWARAHAGASMYTTARDYARFVCAVLNNVQLSAEATILMLTPQIEIDSQLSWSLGFGGQRDTNGMGFWQWGDYGIYRNFILAYEKPRSGVVWFTNSFYGLGIIDDLVARTLGGKAHARNILGYRQYDTPFAQFMFLAMEKGVDTALAHIPEFQASDSEFLDEGAINGVGYSLLGAGRIDDALSLFKLNVQEYPESSNAWDSYAEGHMKAGLLDSAVTFYERSLALDSTNRGAAKRIEWMDIEIDARDHPVELTTEELERFVGQYGPRRIRVQDGMLRYLREGTGSPERFLYPLKPNLFGLEGNPEWRFRFAVDDDGQAIAIEGWMATGMVDRHERDK